MNPDQISLKSVSKSFEYEKISRDIDKIEDVETLKSFAKCYAKLYYKQQEVLADLVT